MTEEERKIIAEILNKHFCKPPNGYAEALEQLMKADNGNMLKGSCNKGTNGNIKANSNFRPIYPGIDGETT